MLKKIEIKFFELYEKRKKVYLGASEKDILEVVKIESKLKSNRQAEKMAKKQEDAVKRTEQLKKAQEDKSKAREKSQFLTGHRNFMRSNKPRINNQVVEVVVVPQDELDKQKYLGIKLD